MSRDFRKPSQLVATTCALLLVVLGFKIQILGRVSWMMEPRPEPGDISTSVTPVPRRGGPAVYPPPDFTPGQLPGPPPESERSILEPFSFGLYPFIGPVPLESVGAGLVLFALNTAVLSYAWLGVILLVTFSAGHTIVDWVSIAALILSLLVYQFAGAGRARVPYV